MMSTIIRIIADIIISPVCLIVQISFYLIAMLELDICLIKYIMVIWNQF